MNRSSCSRLRVWLFTNWSTGHSPIVPDTQRVSLLDSCNLPDCGSNAPELGTRSLIPIVSAFRFILGNRYREPTAIARYCNERRINDTSSASRYGLARNAASE